MLQWETSASLSLGGSGREPASRANNPSVVTPGGCQGTTGCGRFCPFPSLPFLAATARHRLGHLPFLTARLPMSSLPPEAPGSEALGPSFSVGASQAPLGGRSWEEGMQGWQGLCALLLPSCRDTRHTLASTEGTSGPAATLRHRAEHAEALPVNPSLLPSGWAQEAFLHERSPAPPPPLLFPLFLSSFGPLQGAPWERGEDGQIGGAAGSGLRG